VLTVDSIPLAPSLASAHFSDSGAQIFVRFDSDTNQVGHVTPPAAARDGAGHNELGGGDEACVRRVVL
jgi:hypothetical protein